ncbi:hypothetical protein ABID23_000982 [Bartonella silvatica]|uniref:Uncharacterized protein n=1 Tax=Bartonella silvatica TaxID=357760 RepID=A0ABV2HH84_9HYPH
MDENLSHRIENLQGMWGMATDWRVFCFSGDCGIGGKGGNHCQSCLSS